MTPVEFNAWVQEARTHGVPLNTSALQAIAQRTTRAQLIAALGQPASNAGSVVFSGASAALFPAVVKATLQGSVAAPADSGTEAAVTIAASAVHKAAQPVAKKEENAQ